MAKKLQPPSDFAFPYTPYPIQTKFMIDLYNVLEEKKLGIFESPTGTGKSLSIICSALRWLKDHTLRERVFVEEKIANLDKEVESMDESTDWLNIQSKAIQKKKEIHNLKVELKKFDDFDAKIKSIVDNKRKKLDRFNNIKHSKPNDIIENDDQNETDKDTDTDKDIILEEILELEDNDKSIEETEEENISTKIYFCSRTHSQLAQFASEIINSPFGNDVRVTTLASRQYYCINDNVKSLKSNYLINDRCLELQQLKNSKVKKSKDGHITKRCKGSAGCPYLKQSKLDELNEKSLTEIMDVEKLVINGKSSLACPYYASRKAAELSEIILIPYNMLLNKSTRSASGINLKDNVIIIDEAHNLLETINHIHSCVVTGQTLTHASSVLIQYRNRFSKKFSPFNLLYLNQMIFVIDKMIKTLVPKEKDNSNVHSEMNTLQDFLLNCGFDTINFFNLLNFCKKSKISQKLQNYSRQYQQEVSINENKKTESGFHSLLKGISKNSVEENKNVQQTTSIYSENNNALLDVINFFETFTNSCEDGRIVCARYSSLKKSYYKYLLLNPAAHFSDIIKEARAIIVAGGTMQPISEFSDQLFKAAGAEAEKISVFSYSHIVPKENILPIALTSGPSGTTLNFSFEFRESVDILNELGRILYNVCNIVPAGIVCFFPSYNYEEAVYSHLTKNGTILKLEMKKKIYRETRQTTNIETILEQYTKTIQNCKEGNNKINGALLFSVVGGKLSEGLNFRDDLGRCIIVVGLPYPNSKSIELQEKMKYLSTNINPSAGNIYYENLCMKAVNQSIGRAVRHKDDYACVLLLDQRYSKPSVYKALPTWIQASYVSYDRFGQAVAAISKFFAAKKKKNNN